MIIAQKFQSLSSTTSTSTYKWYKIPENLIFSHFALSNNIFNKITRMEEANWILNDFQYRLKDFHSSKLFFAKQTKRKIVHDSIHRNFFREDNDTKKKFYDFYPLCPFVFFLNHRKSLFVEKFLISMRKLLRFLIVFALVWFW